jgi:tRNA pseudouridine38-40 synthase
MKPQLLGLALVVVFKSSAWILPRQHHLQLSSSSTREESHLSSTTAAAADLQEEEHSSVRILLCISYDGCRFTGWTAGNDPKNATTASTQVVLSSKSKPRPGFVRSVQGVLQQNLAKLYGNVPLDRVVVDGCSRTDKGVHAQGMVAQIYCLDDNRPLPMDLPKLMYTLNRMFPWDVRVTKAAYAPESFHPSLSSTSKTYQYRISHGALQDPTQWRSVWHVPRSNTALDLEQMREAARHFVGSHDFGAFRGAPRGKSDKEKRLRQSTICKIANASVEREETTSWSHAHAYLITIRGDRFLYKMVRFLVGSIVGVATDQLQVHDLERALQTGSRGNIQIECAPAHGLVLKEVEYDMDMDIDWQQPTR